MGEFMGDEKYFLGVTHSGHKVHIMMFDEQDNKLDEITMDPIMAAMLANCDGGELGEKIVDAARRAWEPNGYAIEAWYSDGGVFVDIAGRGELRGDGTCVCLDPEEAETLVEQVARAAAEARADASNVVEFPAQD